MVAWCYMGGRNFNTFSRVGAGGALPYQVLGKPDGCFANRRPLPYGSLSGFDCPAIEAAYCLPEAQVEP